MILSFDETAALLDEIAEEFPAPLFEGLNAGVNLQEDARSDPDFPAGEVAILGEYFHGLMGHYINLYYGSFVALAEREGWSRKRWRKELRKTFAHELTHHLEHRAGLHDLDDQDAARKEAWQAKFSENP